MKCSECGGEMEKGLIPDARYAGTGKLMWIDKIVHLKMKPAEKMYGVESYRCVQCGFLKNFANQKL